MEKNHEIDKCQSILESVMWRFIIPLLEVDQVRAQLTEL